MVHDALEVVKLRRDFYRDSYRKVVMALLLSLLIIAGLVLALMYVSADKPTPKYFAATDSGRIIPLIPLNQPNLNNKAILQWASEAIISLYSYNFVNYREAFQENEKYFTSAGWRSFMRALDASQNVKAVQDRKLIVSAVLSGAPVITNRFVVDGRYTWVMQMPILVTYQGGGERTDQRFLVNLKIRRISTLDNIYGVGISEFVAQQK